MVKNNPYYIKTEIKKPIETVYELENKELIIPEKKTQIINDFEERQNLAINKSKLSPAARTKIVKKHGTDYLSERAFNHDIALTQMYGPGFWDDIKSVVKPVATGALVVASVFPPTAPIALPLTVTVAAAGATTLGVGHAIDNKDCKEVGWDLLEIAHGANNLQGEVNGSGMEANKVASAYIVVNKS